MNLLVPIILYERARHFENAHFRAIQVFCNADEGGCVSKC